MAAVENDDINVLLDHLSMARELVGDYRQKLIDAEPEEYGVYRDAIGRLWIHEFTNHQWELIEAGGQMLPSGCQILGVPCHK